MSKINDVLIVKNNHILTMKARQKDILFYHKKDGMVNVKNKRCLVVKNNQLITLKMRQKEYIVIPQIRRNG
jgi:hypothetical protein